jgi:hypothetical protein
MIAKRITKELTGWRGEARLYQLDPPLNGHKYVVVSATVVDYSGAETYIFGADRDGRVTDWGELPGSFQGGTDHEGALRNVGYEV